MDNGKGYHVRINGVQEGSDKLDSGTGVSLTRMWDKIFIGELRNLQADIGMVAGQMEGC